MPAFFFFIWSQFCYCEQIIWLVYSSCVLLLLLSRIRRVRLCNLMDSSPPGSPIPGILQARTLEWVAISFSNAWEWRVKLNSLSHVQLFEPHGLRPTRLLRLWDFPGKSTGVSFHCLFQLVCSPAWSTKFLIYSVLDLLISWYPIKSPLCPGLSFLFLWMVPISKQTDYNVTCR